MAKYITCERDLLRKILDKTNYINYACNDKIRNEIEELLDQPEQEIACWGSFDLGGKCVGTHETRRLAAQIQGGNEVYPLYTSPPKQEPLSEKEIREGNQSMLNATREAFIAGVRFAEVMHGIGGGE